MHGDELRVRYLGDLREPWSGVGHVVKIPDSILWCFPFYGLENANWSFLSFQQRLNRIHKVLNINCIWNTEQEKRGVPILRGEFLQLETTEHWLRNLQNGICLFNAKRDPKN